MNEQPLAAVETTQFLNIGTTLAFLFAVAVAGFFVFVIVQRLRSKNP